MEYTLQSWYYQNKEVKEISDMPINTIGFVYKITDITTGKIYIGKKILTNTRKTKISQRVKKNTGTRKTYNRITKESDWKTYYGSSKTLIEDIQKYGKKRFRREILEYCKTKKQMSFAEIKYQFTSGVNIQTVLEIDSYNENILGRYFKKDLKDDLCPKKKKTT